MLTVSTRNTGFVYCSDLDFLNISFNVLHCVHRRSYSGLVVENRCPRSADIDLKLRLS